MPHGKGLMVFALLLCEPDIIDTYGHIYGHHINCQIIINYLISNIKYTMIYNV